MDVTLLLLSWIQFAFTVSFDIVYPSFTIGLAAWLTVLEGLHLVTGRAEAVIALPDPDVARRAKKAFA
jgi:cytochrome bd-type quinol oxidase subunit 1